MMQAIDRGADNQQNYDRLMVSLEASQGKLDLLIAVCEDQALQSAMIQQYEQELQQQGVQTFRVFVNWQDPSLRYALEQLIDREPGLQAGQPAVVTVQGVEALLSVRLDAPQSQQERFFGYLQWTREALRRFSFPIVLWVTAPILCQLARQAPDFWSWRGGVFWFGLNPDEIHRQKAEPTSLKEPFAPIAELDGALLQLLQRIEQLEQAPEPDLLQLATLFEQLGVVYASRGQSVSNHQFAIQAYQRAIHLQRQLGHQAELADSLTKLGDLYFELKDDLQPAVKAYEEALQIYRQQGDRLGVAHSLKAMGDVLQLLNQRGDALSHYQQALQIYRQQGDRLGVAHSLKAMGDVRQLLTQRRDALSHYQQALEIYRRQGDRLGVANSLKAMGDVRQLLTQRRDALSHYEEALELYRQEGERLGTAHSLKAIGDVLQLLDQRGDALSHYEEALEIYREAGDRLGAANSLKAIGDVLQFLNQRGDALSHYEEALEIYREAGDRLGAANSLKAIGDVLQVLDQRSDALSHYEQALGIYREEQNRLEAVHTKPPFLRPPTCG